jgi:hypothetical protein
MLLESRAFGFLERFAFLGCCHVRGAGTFFALAYFELDRLTFI